MSDNSIAFQAELMAVAYRLADAARPIALRHFREYRIAVDNKRPAGFDPVTIADREIEQAFREILKVLRPDDAVMGEEFEDSTGTSGLTWIVDPIDGTRGFISGMPTWGVLIAVADASGPLFGIIDQPFTGERFVGGFGSAVMHHQGASRSLDTRNCGSLANAVLYSTFPEVGTESERFATECQKQGFLGEGGQQFGEDDALRFRLLRLRHGRGRTGRFGNRGRSERLRRCSADCRDRTGWRHRDGLGWRTGDSRRAYYRCRKRRYSCGSHCDIAGRGRRGGVLIRQKGEYLRPDLVQYLG